MYDLENVLGPAVTEFVDRHIRSLLTWDVLVFFHRNPDAVVDMSGLAAHLSRRVEEIEPEVAELCNSRILSYTGGLVRYRSTPETRAKVDQFIDTCNDRDRRLALIAIVLGKVNPGA